MLRPDIVLYNPKTVVLVELTVPFYERMSEAKQRKEDKYEELIEEIAASGTKAELHAMEVGTRGIIRKSSFSWFKDISSFCRKYLFQLKKSVCNKVLCCSYALWSKRDSTEWN